MRELLALRRRYPDRVHLVLGNRDVNKMRLSTELAECRWVAAEQHPALRYGAAPAAFLRQHGLADTIPNRLKWMLAETMGSPNAFEFRRRELSSAAPEPSGGSAARPAVSDEDVLASFQATVLPGGEVTEYLRAAKLVVRVGETLIVHGSIGAGAAGVAPAATASPPPDPDGGWWPLEHSSGLGSLAALQGSTTGQAGACWPTRCRCCWGWAGTLAR